MSENAPLQLSDVKNWLDTAPQSLVQELQNRLKEVKSLQQETQQEGTVAPQTMGSMQKFITNSSTVSVETYKKMLDTDETLGSGVDFVIQNMVARFGEYRHPVPEIQAFVRKALTEMEGSWHQNLDEMFSAEWAGFSVSEIVWKYTNDFDGFPAWVPRKIVTLPPLSVVFAVDRFGEVLEQGIYQYQRYDNYYSTSMGAMGSYLTGGYDDLDGFRPDFMASTGDFFYPVRIGADITFMTAVINKDKCIHLTSSTTAKFGNPYGRSFLRRTYKSWVAKDATLKSWIVAADRKGTPLTVGYAAPHDTVRTQMMGNSPGIAPQQKRSATQAMADVFSNIHSSSYVVLPGRKDEHYSIETVQSQGDMNIYKDAVEYYNKACMRGMLLPPLVMTGGDGAGSYALGQEHNKIFNSILDGKLKVYKQIVIEQFVRRIIGYNFPPAMYEKHGFGEFELEQTDWDLIDKQIQAITQLTQSQYMSPENPKDFQYARQVAKAPKSEHFMGSTPPYSQNGELDLPQGDDPFNQDQKPSLDPLPEHHFQKAPEETP